MPSRQWLRVRRGLVRLLSRRRAVLLFLCCFFLWSTMFSLFWETAHTGPGPSAVSMGRSRLDAARQFVARLATEQREVVDGPYTGRLTGYDTKKLLAVLLDRLMSRLSSVERFAARRANISCPDSSGDAEPPDGRGSGGSGAQEAHKGGPGPTRPPKVNAVDLLLGAQEQCNLNPVELIEYPQCEEKIKWMEKFWRSHSCYRRLGVDGSVCSFIIYLSEVETFCPRLPSRANLHLDNNTVQPLMPRTDAAPLLNDVLTDFSPRRPTFGFVRERAARLWPQWVAAAERLHRRRKPRRRRLHIHLHLGLLSQRSHFGIAEGSSKGGPLGELVQWADLIAALFALGHDLRVTTETQQLASMMAQNPLLVSPCLAPRYAGLADVIFTDIVGLRQLQARFKQGYARIQCVMRVLDTFGTQPLFNLRSYAIRKRAKSPWGGAGLQPRQFYNLYPMTSDNSFLGFVVDGVTAMRPQPSPQGREIALIYGKKAYMWKGIGPYLRAIHELLEVHATVSDPSPRLVPDFVVNHYFLTPRAFQSLLQRARVFVGLGFPFEGPAPLEAIAHGAVFLNPRFRPPLSRANARFFRDKPTERKVGPRGGNRLLRADPISISSSMTSQHPYVERFLGEPHSFLVDTDDLPGVKRVLRRILSAPRPPVGRVPHELTAPGMLQRVDYFLRRHDFCAEARRSLYGYGLVLSGLRPARPRSRLWPPPDAVRYFLGTTGVSCEDTCVRQDRICEPAHFSQLNSVSALHELSGLTCDRVAYAENHLAPFRRSEGGEVVSCTFQSQPLLFSCAGAGAEVQRLCPCRDYMRGQTALCKSCDV